MGISELRLHLLFDVSGLLVRQPSPTSQNFGIHGTHDNPRVRTWRGDAAAARLNFLNPPRVVANLLLRILPLLIGRLLIASLCAAEPPTMPFDTEPSPTRPLAAEEAAARMQLPPGFRATVFAAEPDVRQPIAMTTDARGEPFFINTVIGHLWHVIPGAHYRRMLGDDPNPHVYELLEQNADHVHWATGEVWTDVRKGVTAPTLARRVRQ